MRKVLYILGQLSDVDVAWLARAGTRKRHPIGTVLIRYGVALDSLFIILDGAISIRTNRGFELASVGAGEVLGEMSFVDSRPPSASAVVTSDAYVLAIEKTVIQSKLEADTGFASRFYRAVAIFMSERMRDQVGRMGYGDAPEDPADEDELDANVLDNVHLAGARFERLLTALMG